MFEHCSIIRSIDEISDCQNVDYADIHEVIFKNITIELEDTIPTLLLQTIDDQKYENADMDYIPSTITSEVSIYYEYSAGSTRRGKNKNLTFDNINFYGRHKPKFNFRGYDEEYLVSSVTISDFFVNGKPLMVGEYELNTNEFCHNIKFTIDICEKKSTFH